MNLKKVAGLTGLSLALVLGLMIFGGQKALAATSWFVDPVGNDTNDCLSGGTACLTLQAAIDKAAAGDTISVAAGTYAVSGIVTVNKTLTIAGAQVGMDARTRLVPLSSESILQNTGGLSVTANNVVIDGFIVETSVDDTPFGTGFGIALGAGTSGATVVNNIIQNNIAGLGLANDPAGNQAVIHHNLFRTNTQVGTHSGHGIYSDQVVAGAAGIDDVVIDGNDFVVFLPDFPTATWGIGINNTGLAQDTNLMVLNNKFNTLSPNSAAMYFRNTDASSIKGNSIKNKTDYGIAFFGGDDGIVVECNTIETPASPLGIGIWVTEGVSSNITARDNNISGNFAAGLQVDGGSYSGGTGSLLAGSNWWGDASGPNPPGAGDAIVDPGSVVTFIPFRTAPLPDADNDGQLECPNFQVPAGGVFVVGNNVNLSTGSTVNFWGPQWDQNNPTSGASTPGKRAFKGFENGVATPTCSGTWTSRPGNSSNPPATVPQFMAVIVSSSIQRSGPVFSGDVKKIVVIEVDPGYGPAPGHRGTGKVVSVICQ